MNVCPEDHKALLIEPIAIPPLEHTGLDNRKVALGGDGVYFYSNGRKSKCMKEKIQMLLHDISKREESVLAVVKSAKKGPVKRKVGKLEKANSSMLLSRHRARNMERTAEDLVRDLRNEASNKGELFRYV